MSDTSQMSQGFWERMRFALPKLLTVQDEEAKANIGRMFGQAKALSDFVGINISLVFLTGCYNYCFSGAARKGVSLFMTANLFVGGFFFFFAAMVLLFLINRIIYDYLRMHLSGPTWLRSVLTFVVIYQYIAITSATNKIITVLATNFVKGS